MAQLSPLPKQFILDRMRFGVSSYHLVRRYETKAKQTEILFALKKYGGRKGNGMKATGIVRKMDELGRIVLPIELRRQLDINERDSVEIYTDKDSIILKKYQPSCIFCDNVDEISEFKGKNVCNVCRQSLAEQAECL